MVSPHLLAILPEPQLFPSVLRFFEITIHLLLLMLPLVKFLFLTTKEPLLNNMDN